MQTDARVHTASHQTKLPSSKAEQGGRTRRGLAKPRGSDSTDPQLALPGEASATRVSTTQEHIHADAAQGRRRGILGGGQTPLTMFLALTLRVRQMTSKTSCTGTETGAPNSELQRISRETSGGGGPSASLLVRKTPSRRSCSRPSLPHSLHHLLTHLSRSPRQRASPENLCRSRRRTWASPSSEGESSASTAGPSYCMGAAQKHNLLHAPGLSSIPSFLPYSNPFCLKVMAAPLQITRLVPSCSVPPPRSLPVSAPSYRAPSRPCREASRLCSSCSQLSVCFRPWEKPAPREGSLE